MPAPAGDDVGLAVEVTRLVPASGNLTVCGQQFWLSPTRAGLPVTLWTDTTVIHLLIDGVRLKTVPSRLTLNHLRQLLADDGVPAGPPPITSSPVQAGAPIEVDRLVNATGLIGLAGRQHPVGYHFAGRRVTVRLDRGLMQITADGVLLRTLPNPLTAAEIARIRDARPAGPPPQPASQPPRVERRVSCRGSLVIAGQRIHVGIRHAGATLTVEAADTTFRIHDGDQVVTEVPRTTTKSIARFKVRKPEPPRRAAPRGALAMNGTVKHVLLYRTPQRWRISVWETPDAIGCGDLPDTPPDAPIEAAQQDLLEHLRRHWNFTGQLTWREERPDRWIATPTTN